jgi:signal peptidase I
MEQSNQNQPVPDATARRRRESHLISLAIITILLVIFYQMALMPIKVVGISMQPTYPDGAFSLVNKLAYVRHVPERGDVIAIRGESRGIYYMKRIVALPGERLAVIDGDLVVNGKPLEEPYVEAGVPWQIKRLHLKEDEYFVIGDNRPLSSFGPIKREQIVGKVLF